MQITQFDKLTKIQAKFSTIFLSLALIYWKYVYKGSFPSNMKFDVSIKFRAV